MISARLLSRHAVFHRRNPPIREPAEMGRYSKMLIVSTVGGTLDRRFGGGCTTAKSTRYSPFDDTSVISRVQVTPGSKSPKSPDSTPSWRIFVKDNSAARLA